MGKFVAIALGLTLTSGLAASEPRTLDLWPGPPPGDTGSIGEEEVTKLPDGKIGRITNVSKPTITVYRPESNTGLAMVICPGGGYNVLAWDHEGEQVARWLNENGITAVL